MVNQKIMTVNVDENAVNDNHDDVLNVESRESDIADKLPEEADVDAVDDYLSETGKASTDPLHQEQLPYDNLASWWSKTKQNKGGLYVKDGLLYHNEKFMCYEIEQLFLPKGRIGPNIKLAHEGWRSFSL
jgi:hypothetical protein